MRVTGIRSGASASRPASIHRYCVTLHPPNDKRFTRTNLSHFHTYLFPLSSFRILNIPRTTDIA
ncbi:hypothetical protein NSND_50081 [Nitrospira sp. ND1]|nr:hypothetical protein NSND_50081 [Nitrospira sp. ND1]